MAKKGKNQISALHTALIGQLNNYPNFLQMLPSNYPSHSKYKITDKQMFWYNKNRQRDHWSHFNLPSLLHNSLYNSNPKVNALTLSILDKFEEFSKTFATTPGAKKTLEPLWTSPWDLGDPKLWSVLGECSLGLLFHSRGMPIHGFGRKVGQGKQNADIKTTFNGRITYVDVEMQNIKEVKGTRFNFRKLIVGRGRKKIHNKFPHLPKGEYGAVALIFSVSGENLHRFTKQRLWATRPVFTSYIDRNPFAQTYWLIGGTFNNNFGFHIIDRSTIQVEQPDSLDKLMSFFVENQVIKDFDKKIHWLITKILGRQ